jgi:hypothetical protein
VLNRLYPYAAVEFVESDREALGPEVGTRPPRISSYPVAYGGRRIGSLVVGEAGEGDRPLLERVATLVSAYVLVGWDTGGVAWEDG